jgi:hypothetical protein
LLIFTISNNIFFISKKNLTFLHLRRTRNNPVSNDLNEETQGLMVNQNTLNLTRHMKKIFLVLAVAGYMSACAPTSNTTSSTGTTTDGTTSDSNTSDDSTTGTSGTGTSSSSTGTTNSSSDANSSSSSTSMDADSTNSSTTDADMETNDSSSSTESSSDMGTASSATKSDIMGSSTTITMDQLPKAVRNSYMKLPGHSNATGVKVYQVKTSEHPVLYKIEGTSGSTNYTHYFTPEGNEVKMSDMK